MTVYFIRGETTGYVKIGVANAVKNRLPTLQTGSAERLVLLGTVPGDVATEHRFHRLFAEQHVLGEWFALSSEDLAAIGIVAQMAAEAQPARFFKKPKLNAIAAIAERDQLLRQIEHLNKVVARLKSINIELRYRLDALSPTIIPPLPEPEPPPADPPRTRWRRLLRTLGHVR